MLLPPAFLDRLAITQGKPKQCHTALVLLYFLFQLCRRHDFSAEFSQPIDVRAACIITG